jgi:DNA-binding CsgD family transcriptional regulator
LVAEKSDMDQFSRLVGDIYDASFDPGRWRPVLQGVCKFVNAGFGILITEDAVSSKAHAHYTSKDDPEWLDSYFSKYIRMNPMLVPALSFEVGRIFSMSSFMTHRQFRSSLFFKEWVSPRGYIDTVGTMLEKSPTSISVLSAVRSKKQGVVDKKTLHRMGLVTPHIQRAIAIGRTLELSSCEASALADTLDGFAAGIFIVDRRGAVAHANTNGERMLQSGSLLRRANGMLIATDAKANAALAAAIAACDAGDAAIGTKGLAIMLSGRSAEKHVAYELPLTAGTRKRAGATYSAVAAVFVRKVALELPSPLQTISELYGLTTRELSVFLAIVEVGGVPDVSALLGLSDATVKGYLKDIFRKTATTRQADLVKLAAGLANPFAAPKPP